MKPFAALYEALAAGAQRDAERMRAVLASAPPERTYTHAVRHKCVAALFDSIAENRVRDDETAGLRVLLGRYVARCVLDSADIGPQVESLVRILNGARVPHCLLKSAARIYAGETRAERTHICDIDIFIPREHAQSAVAALQAGGYAYQYPELADYYLRIHHHLSPMVHESFARPVELHVRLALPGYFSTPNDWHALQAHLEPIDGPAGQSLQLDAFGRCLHLAMHGVGLNRLRDAAHIARELRSTPELAEQLRDRTHGESTHRVALQSVICAAAHIAGIEVPFDKAVRRFVRWAVEREDLPPALRLRAQLLDAWYENGRSLRGPATASAMECSARTAAARILAGAIAFARLPAQAR